MRRRKRRPKCFRTYWLSVAVQIYGDERQPDGPALIERLRDPLPTGFAAICTLDLANTFSRQGRLEKHPFDGLAGHLLLEGWLSGSDPEHFSYARSSAAALPYLAQRARQTLAALAMDHPDPPVQMEAARASACGGAEAGLKFLSRMCLDPRYSQSTQRHLKELDRTDLIPTAALEPNFKAMCEMCEWLAFPTEFGQPPTEIEVYDTRELFWPPTKDRRRLWLLRYTYKNWTSDGQDNVGVGMVGSQTFALFGETSADMCPEDIYGLHCCWELQDRRAPSTEQRAKAGRKLLGI
jgi:hypothetical protein